MSAIDVWVIEDNDFLRETIQEILVGSEECRCTLAAPSCEEALSAMDGGRPPQVVLMDLGLPGMSGVEGIRRILAVSPTTRVVVLTVHQDDEKVFDAICAGASGYLLKPATSDRIVEAVGTAFQGGAPMNAFIARRVMEAFAERSKPRSENVLTSRETEILELVAQERTLKEIAKALFLSPHTVDTHLRNIYAKLHVHSRSGAVAKALHERWI